MTQRLCPAWYVKACPSPPPRVTDTRLCNKPAFEKNKL